MITNDYQLHRRWEEKRDAEAFNELVQRYASLVYATSRRILGNESDAEDVTQECFLALARGDSRVAKHLSGWLHRVATNQSLKYLRAKGRRKQRETRFAREIPQDGALEFEDISEFLDELIEELPKSLRHPIIAHFFERRTHAQIATELGIARQTVSARVQKGVARIREDLRKRGIVTTTTTLAAVILNMPVSEASTSLFTKISKIGIAGPVAPAAAANGLGGAFVLKAGLAACTALVVGGVLLYTILGLQQVESDTRAEQSEGSVAGPSIDGDGSFRLIVADVEGQEPATSAAGSNRSLSSVVAPAATDPSLEPGEIPKSTPGLSVQGTIVNDAGKPVQRAAILLVATGYNGPQMVFRPFAAFRDRGHHYHARSDSEGRFRINGIRYRGGGLLSVSAKGYVTRPTRLWLSSETRETSFTVVLDNLGLPLTARVVSADGSPVDDGFVVAPISLTNVVRTVGLPRDCTYTDRQGVFRLGFYHQGETFHGRRGWATVTVSSPQYGNATFSDVPLGGSETVELRMPQPASLVGRITGAPGAFAEARVVLGEILKQKYYEPDGSAGRPEGDFGHSNNFIVPLTEDGTFEFKGIPSNREFRLRIIDSSDSDLLPRRVVAAFDPGEVRFLDEPYEEPIRVTGRVLGLSTGEPLDNVRILQGRSFRDFVENEQAWTDENGEFTIVVKSSVDVARVFPIYGWTHPQLISKIASSFGKRIDFSSGQLVREDFVLPEPVQFTVNVVDQADVPVADADVIISSEILGGTDTNGEMSIELDPRHRHPYSARKSGYLLTHHTWLEVDENRRVAERTIVLHLAAGGVEGVFVDELGNPIAGANVRCRVVANDEVVYKVQGTSYDKGVFYLLEWCPVGTYEALVISCEGGDWNGSVRLENVTMNAGQDQVTVLVDPIVGTR